MLAFFLGVFGNLLAAEFGAWCPHLAERRRHTAAQDSSGGRLRRTNRLIPRSSPDLSREERFLPGGHRHGR